MLLVLCSDERAAETEESTSLVISSELGAVCEASQGALPTVPALRQRIRQVRKQLLRTAPPNPTKLSELIIPDEYSKYSPSHGHTENFLLYDSGPSDDRIRLSFLQKIHLKRSTNLWSMRFRSWT